MLWISDMEQEPRSTKLLQLDFSVLIAYSIAMGQFVIEQQRYLSLMGK